MIEVSVHYSMSRGDADKVRVEFAFPKKPFLVWKDFRFEVLTKFPRGYGRAYRDYLRGRELLVPMPFNVVVGFMIWAYQWVRYGAEYWFSRHRPGEK